MNKNLNEQLDKSRILMGYDLKKTAIENKKIVEEQAATNASPVPPPKAPLKSAGTTPVPPTGISPSSAPAPAPAANPVATNTNILTDQDLMGNTNKMRSFLQTLGDFSRLGLSADSLGFNVVNLLGGRRTGVKGVVDALDGWVDLKDLVYVLSTVTSLKGKQYLDDTQEPPVKIPAMQRFVELYLEDEGDDLIADVQGVGTKTLPAGTEKIKTKIVNMINSLLGESPSASTDTGTPAPGKTGGGYKPCTEFPFSYGCANQAIGEIQKCLGLTADGKFGPKTTQALISKGFDGKTITKEIYDTIKTKMCGGSSSTDTRLTQLIRHVQKDGNISYVKNKLSVEDSKILTDYLGKSGYVPTNDPVLVKKYMAYHIWTNPNISPIVQKVRGLPNQPVTTNAPNAPTKIRINESQLKNLIGGISLEDPKKTDKK